MDSIDTVLEDLRQGRMIVLVDDEGRENEGDLVCAADCVTPDIINFMLREGRGMLCVPLSGEYCDRLELPPQSAINTSQHTTAYTITVDAHDRFGITTGVSAADRATTISRLADPTAVPNDFARPGHVQPLRARDGGVLVRAGQTEGSVDLCRLAGLNEAAVIIEVMNDDGTMARRPELQKICQKHDIKMCSVADVIQHRLEREQMVRRTMTEPFETQWGEFTLIAYHSIFDSLPHVALVCGNVDEADEPVLVRMHRQNLLGDVLGDIKNLSGDALHTSMQMIQKEGRGVIVYLRHALGDNSLQQYLHCLDLPQATPPLRQGAHGIGCQILRDLGIQRLQLITRHPFQPTALDGFGLTIDAFVKPEI